MENANESVAQTQESSASTEKQTANTNNSAVDDYKRDMFKYKQKAKELEDRLQEYALADEQKKGNLEGVINALKDENRRLKQETAQSRLNFAEGKLEDAVKGFALKKGCKDPETFYKLIDRNDLQTVELDDKFRASSDDIASIVERYMGKYEHLGFFGKSVNIVDKSPSNAPVNKPKTKSLDDMSHEELMALARKQGLKTINR
jgi:hypothetical protein